MDNKRVTVARFEVTQNGEHKITVAPEFEPHAAWDPDSFFEEMVHGLEGKELRFTVEVIGPVPDDDSYAVCEKES